METNADQIKSEGKFLNEKPNKFDWSRLGPNMIKKHRDHINKNPYRCDDCCDTYNKDDLHEVESEWLCQNCLCSG